MNSGNKGREYTTKDIANIVSIAPPTVRKYAQALEKAGYKFLKNENGSRIFIDKDILVLNEVKDISNSRGMKVEKIAEMIVFNQRQAIQHEAEADTVEIIPEESEKSNDIAQYDTRYNELMSKLSKLEMIDDMAKELKEVKEQISQRDQYIKESLERRDRELMQAMRQSLEESKTRALQEAAAAEEKKEKGLWGRIVEAGKIILGK
jgi:DNA-binding transcriptional MerR regulator